MATVELIFLVPLSLGILCLILGVIGVISSLFSRPADILGAVKGLVHPDEVKGILHAYGDLLTDTSAPIIRDESRLPTSKDRVKKALWVAIVTAKTEEEREGYCGAYLFLSDFQAGVGPSGLWKLPVPASADEIAASLPWLKNSLEEKRVLSEELDALFKKFGLPRRR